MRPRRWRLAVAGVMVAMLVAACSSGDDRITASPGSSTIPGGGPGPDAGTVDGGSGGGSAGGTVRGGGDGTAPTGSGGGSATTSPSTAAAPDPPPSTGPVGSYGPAYLRPAPVQRIAVEVIRQNGIDVSDQAHSHALGQLGEVSGKDIVRTTVNFTSTDQTWTAAEILQRSDASGRVTADRSTAVLRVLMLEGRSDMDSALGIAVRGDTVALFPEAIDSAAGLLASEPIERAVYLHEIGHVLGLVDLVLSTGREDPDHPGHSRSDRSVMYWAVETDLISQLLGSGPPDRFDADDRADLAAIAAS